MNAPMPLEWHPYYRDKTWLLDWLKRRGTYGHLHDVRIPVFHGVVAFTMPPGELYPEEPSMEYLVMTRRRAAGPAPYVGDPFHYEWYVGEDNLGRRIAGEARIVYEPWCP